MGNMVLFRPFTSAGPAGNVVAEEESLSDACFVRREAACKEENACERGGQSNRKHEGETREQ